MPIPPGNDAKVVRVPSGKDLFVDVENKAGDHAPAIVCSCSSPPPPLCEPFYPYLR